MNIRIVNKFGFSAETCGDNGIRLLDYPDFGCPEADFKTDKIPGHNGEFFRSSDIGIRDIFLKVEAGLPFGLISGIFAPGIEVDVVVDDRWSIRGHISGLKQLTRPARLAKPVMNISIRCFNPFFEKINGAFSMSFENHGGGIYQGGGYTCTQLNIINNGDVACPFSVTMRSNALSDSAPSGLFNTLDWNDGSPIYTGIVFKKGTDTGRDFFITTDTVSDRFFESRDVMGECEYFLIPPGKSTLYAQNVSGVLTFNPQYLYIDGRDL